MVSLDLLDKQKIDNKLYNILKYKHIYIIHVLRLTEHANKKTACGTVDI